MELHGDASILQTKGNTSVIWLPRHVVPVGVPTESQQPPVDVMGTLHLNH